MIPLKCPNCWANMKSAPEITKDQILSRTCRAKKPMGCGTGWTVLIRDGQITYKSPQVFHHFLKPAPRRW